MSRERTTATIGAGLGFAFVCGLLLLIVAISPDPQQAAPPREDIFRPNPDKMPGTIEWEYVGWIEPVGHAPGGSSRWRGVSTLDENPQPRVWGSRNEAVRYVTEPSGPWWNFE